MSNRSSFPFGTVCSGIEAPSVAWHDLGWESQFFSEIEPFPCSLLKHYYPHIKNYGDLNLFRSWGLAKGLIRLLAGGTPCQAFSVAGLRKGLDDPRGNLALIYLGLAESLRPDWLVWENVPGVLSSNGGRDFGAFLGALVKLGYGFAYRVLDAQYFGVPQRRRRVFLVAHLGDWRPAAAVLFERSGMRGYPAPRRKTGQAIAGTLGGSSQSGGFRTTDLDSSGAFIVGRDRGGDAAGDGGRIIGGGSGIAGALDTECGGGKMTDQTARNGHLIAEQTGTITARMFASLGVRDIEEGALVADIAGTICHAGRAAGSATQQDAEQGNLVSVFDTTQVTHPDNRSSCKPDACHTLPGNGHAPTIAFNFEMGAKAGSIGAAEELAGTLGGTSKQAVCVSINARQDPDVAIEQVGPLDTDGTTYAIAFGHSDSDPRGSVEVAPTMRSMGSRESNQNTGSNIAVVEAITLQPRVGRNGRGSASDVVPALAGADAGETSDMRPCVAYAETAHTLKAPSKGEVWKGDGCDNLVGTRAGYRVRRLTPRECERLQGFPDDYTLIPDGKENWAWELEEVREYFQRAGRKYTDEEIIRLCCDGPRYKALGNSIAIPPLQWIGRRIAEVDAIVHPTQ